MSSSLSCGFVGLPNVGKSTLFNAVLKSSQANAQNFPFCTIEPNVGHVPIEDYRLQNLAAISKTNKIIPSVLKCVDIAGLIKGAYKGEGLGNQFLGHIRDCDLIIHVLRCFQNDDIIHVEGNVDPLRDYDIISLELQFNDLDKIDKFLNTKKNDNVNLLKKAREFLTAGNFLNAYDWKAEEIAVFDIYGFLTHKPMIVAANLQSKADYSYLEKIQHLNPMPVFASLEVMLQELEDESEKMAFFDELDIKESGLNLILKKAYEKLGLMNFFTTGKEETRAWKIKKGWNMQKASGVIHSDFEKSFISAEVVTYDDFMKYNGWNGAKENGNLKICSKDTLVNDGDICVFKTYR